MVSVVDIIQRFCYGFCRWFSHGFRRRRKRFMVSLIVFVFMVSVVARKRLLMVSVARFSTDSAVAGGFGFWNVSNDSPLSFQDWFPSLVFLMVSVVVGKLFLFYGFCRGQEIVCMVSAVGFFLWFPVATRMRKGRCGDPLVGIFYVDISCFAYARRYISNVLLFCCGETPLLKISVSPRPYTCFQIYALFRYGETTLSACTC